MSLSKTKNYNGHIYVKGELQNILNTSELHHIKSSISVLFFPDNITLKQIKQSLKTIEANIDDLIRKEKYENKISQNNVG